MNADFYRAFEEKYRGPRELIKSRLKVYLPFIEGLRSVHPGMRALDLGCGRGEWLELMREHAIEAQGVDLDTGMLKACRGLNLDVVQTDAVRYLQAQPGASFGVVSAFHVAEHLPFEALQDLVKEVLRVLLPGGLLILETPNPENLVVATRNFYLDPTHLRPIPYELLAFLAEHTGFARIKTMRLQEHKSLIENSSITLSDVFKGVSPDYAIVAQKSAAADILALFDQPFSIEFGLSQDELLSRFDRHLRERIGQAEAKAQQAEAKAQQAEAKARQAEAKAQQAEAKAQQAEVASAQTIMQLQAVYTSTSWRIIAPLRALAGHAFKMSPQRLKLQFTLLLRHAALSVNRRPRLRNAALAALNRLPTLKLRLVSLITSTPMPTTVQENVPAELAHLTPRARQIYADLKAAIEARHEDGR